MLHTVTPVIQSGQYVRIGDLLQMCIHFPKFPCLLFHHMFQTGILILLPFDQFFGEHIRQQCLAHNDIGHRHNDKDEYILAVKYLKKIQDERNKNERNGISPISLTEIPSGKALRIIQAVILFQIDFVQLSERKTQCK